MTLHRVGIRHYRAGQSKYHIRWSPGIQLWDVLEWDGKNYTAAAESFLYFKEARVFLERCIAAGRLL